MTTQPVSIVRHTVEAKVTHKYRYGGDWMLWVTVQEGKEGSP